ncbi:WXG100 family type VII secretion target [Mycolicibacterium vinylchloridicum]|uniref:WXG100 family type VII secretion target n=1 Tax=Mycolicibacterium vinylchloridicum TaxID=2736928 RepID=UPI0015C7114B|nr:WXG100 family type VII secretion target [Mycolicibacterium vinylchloridicum]
MADAFSVNLEGLAEAVAEIAEFQRTAESLLAEIESTVSNLHITWSGEAASAHAEAHRSWTHGAGLMQEALNKLHTVGDTAHGNYTGVMSTNQNMWS